MKVAVIGAGLAGLTAAWTLHRAGVAVRLFDPQPAGGKARSLRLRPDWQIEWGPHSFTGRATPMFDLLHELGLQPVPLGAKARSRYLRRDGVLKKAGPLALRPAELWELLRGLFRRVSHQPEESVATWVERQLGPAMARGPLPAMIKGIWACGPEEVEMAAGFPALTAAVAQQGSLWAALRTLGSATGGTYTVEGGLGSIAAAIVKNTGSPQPERVQAVKKAADGWQVETSEGAELFEGVVLATEAGAAARLLGPVASATCLTALGELRYAALNGVHWLTRASSLPHGFGYLSADPGPILGSIFVSDLLPDRCPPDHRAFTTMIAGNGPDSPRLDNQALSQLLQQEHRQLTGASVEIVDLYRVEHPSAVAIPGPGHAARVQRICDGLPAGVVLAGSYLGSGAMPDAISSGRAAAAALLPRSRP